MYGSIYQKKRVAEQNRKDRIEQEKELRQYLEAAVNVKHVKGRNPLDIDNLSLPKQVELLEAYAAHLQAELDDFIVAWGSDGAWGVSRLKKEIKRVLDHVARLLVKIGRGE